jgi:NAD(P)-dependent dehydrogenase (short-subunit alcohol dehydrogenase family)
LAFVKAYLEADDTLIVATCRSIERATELRTLAEQAPERVIPVALDVADSTSIADSVAQVRAHTDALDLLINNAGILPGGVDAPELATSAFGHLDAEAMLRVFHVNSVSPVMVAQAYADLLRNGNRARLINMSSDAGSITLRSHGCDYSYPASKAALNMLTRCLAGDLRGDGVIVVSVHPGWIQTDMGGNSAPLTLEQTVPSMIRLFDGLTPANSGGFLNWDGRSVAW